MADTPPPSAQSDSSAEPTEFNFDKPASDVPRIKRRSLKAKPTGLQPATAPPAAARELEREAPPLAPDEVARTAELVPDTKQTSQVRTAPAIRSTPIAPPRTTPSVSVASAQRPATVSAPASAPPVATTQKPATNTANPSGVSGQKVNVNLTASQKASVSSPSASPHGTRPATLYYSSTTKKETPTSMKPTTNASPSAPTSTSSSSAASAGRPATTAATASSATRPATAPVNSATRSTTANIDYRANVERQSREQKSVGNILSYFVYGLIAVFVFGAGLATYGAVIIFDKLHDESTSISSLDDKYAAKVDGLNKQLASTQDTLTQAQAQISRQQDLLSKQEEEINQLRTAINASSSASADAIHAEAKARAQEAAALRARIRDLENKTSIQRY